MARWRLTAPHYINVEGTTWEYKEVNRTTGKQKRTVFDVPLLLNPDDPSDWNYVYGRDNGEIVVCDGNKRESKDIIFSGDPTPDMVPLDDEAKAISASFASKWKHPIESLTGSYGDELLKNMQVEMAKVQSAQATAKIEGMDTLLTAIAGMMKQNQDILASLVMQPEAEPKAARRL